MSISLRAVPPVLLSPTLNSWRNCRLAVAVPRQIFWAFPTFFGGRHQEGTAMHGWKSRLISALAVILGGDMAGRALCTTSFAFFSSASAMAAPRCVRATTNSFHGGRNNAVLAKRGLLLPCQRRGLCERILTRTLALRGGDWKKGDAESTQRNASSVHEFSEIFERYRGRMHNSSLLSDEEWQTLQADMARTARGLIQWCKSQPAVAIENPRGIMVVLEGLDKSGKSTQVELLRQSMEEFGNDVRRVSFPDRTTSLGKLIDMFLKVGGNHTQKSTRKHALIMWLR
jgi:hypothetical protein